MLISGGNQVKAQNIFIPSVPSFLLFTERIKNHYPGIQADATVPNLHNFPPNKNGRKKMVNLKYLHPLSGQVIALTGQFVALLHHH